MYKKIILTVIITAAATYGTISYFLPKEAALLPKNLSVSASGPLFRAEAHTFTAGDNFSCKELLVSVVSKNPNKKDEISGEVTRGTTDLSLKINTNDLEVITTTSVKAGSTEADKFSIVANNENEIWAVGIFSEQATSTHVFVLNKKNGLLLWNKSASVIPLMEGYAISGYYSCN